MGTIVEFKDISKTYQGIKVLDNINLHINHRDFMVIFGPPSSGKSTLLRLLVGLESHDKGNIFLRGKDTSRLSAKERTIGYIPQDFALYPNKNVFENIAYPLRFLKKSNSEIKQSVMKIAEMLHIKDLLDKTPTQLSGGQKQRVAIARGIVKQTDIYVFDDPLAGLDFKLREKLIDDLKSLQENLQVCIIYTTSDPIEALSLASKIAILDNHQIIETGRPDSVYIQPAHLSTMKTLGFPKANSLPGTLYRKHSHVRCKTGLFDFQVSLDKKVKEPEDSCAVRVAFRPENICGLPEQKGINLSASIYLREDLGAEEIIYLNEQEETLVMLRSSGMNKRYEVNDRVDISIKPSSLFVFDNLTGNRIGRGAEKLNV
jgi:ABC-type sugar transport system ATPase subunit